MNTVTYPAMGETFYRETLPNGLPVVVVSKPGFRKSYAIFSTRYGGADRRFRTDGDWIDTPAGVAHFLEHKMFDMPDGTDVMGRFSALGASPNAFTSASMTGYHFTCTENFDECLRLLLSYVSTPWFTEESVAKEQGIIAQEIRMYEDSPGSAVYHDLMRGLYATHPLRDEVVGTVESISRITPDVLYSCYNAFYRPGNMALVCVGDIDPASVASLAKEILPSGPAAAPERDYGPEESAFPACAFSERRMNVAAPILYLGAKIPAPDMSGAERFRLQVLGEMAMECLTGESSALFNELYSSGLIRSGFGGGVSGFRDRLMAVAAGEASDPAAVKDAFCEKIAQAARRGLDPAAFRRCLRAEYGDAVSSLDVFGSVAGAVTNGLFNDFDFMDEFTILEQLTAEEATAFLTEYLAPERLATAVVRPAEEKREE